MLVKWRLNQQKRRLGKDVIRLAVILRDECPPEKRVQRSWALDLVRRWYTQALHVACGGDGVGIGLHWLDEEEYGD